MKDMPRTGIEPRVVQDFRTRYVLTHVPRGVPDSDWHPIDVQVKGRSATSHPWRSGETIGPRLT